jgi:hypothetical protein
VLVMPGEGEIVMHAGRLLSAARNDVPI